MMREVATRRVGFSAEYVRVNRAVRVKTEFSVPYATVGVGLTVNSLPVRHRRPAAFMQSG